MRSASPPGTTPPSPSSRVRSSSSSPRHSNRARRSVGAYGKRLPAAHGCRAGLLGVVVVDHPSIGKTGQHLVERDARFETRERGAHAEVDAIAERQVVLDLAVDVEGGAGLGLAVVPVAGSGE